MNQIPGTSDEEPRDEGRRVELGLAGPSLSAEELVAALRPLLESGLGLRVYAGTGSGHSMISEQLGLPGQGREYAVPERPAPGGVVLLMGMPLNAAARATADDRFGPGAADAIESVGVGRGWVLTARA